MIEFSLHKKLHTADGEMPLQIDCAFESGKFVSLHGPSGAGKTSVLRMLAGFMKPDNGYIKIFDDVWFDAVNRINVEPQQRKTGFVFQDYALFPNMNVYENIAFALNRNEPKNFVDELLELTGLSMLATRKIQMLSGGQKQRVALARAIARKPLLLLLDEPLSAIDNTMRVQLQKTLLDVHQRFKLTTIIVSHDQDEIIKLSDIIVHIEDGIIQQQTTPSSFFISNPAQPILKGSIISIDENRHAAILINTRIIKIHCDQNFQPGDKVEIIYKNEDITVHKS